MASTKATTTDLTATDSTTPTPTYTHVGRLGLRSYQSFDTYYHGDGYGMKTHAANVDRSPSASQSGGAKLRYRTLCGKVLFSADGDQGTEFDGGVSEAKEGEGSYISCKRCRRIIKGKGSR
jgi:hypothetical protein